MGFDPFSSGHPVPEPPWQTCWIALPSPVTPGTLCQVIMREGAFQHLIERHVLPGDEPWDEWLAAPVVARLARCWQDGCLASERRAILDQVSAILESAVRHSLRRPLVLSSETRCARTFSRLYATWLVVLSCGAVAIIRHYTGQSLLVTNFFPRAALRQLDPCRRWRAVVSNLVQKYCRLAPEGLIPPGETDQFPVRGDGGTVREFLTRVKFLSLEEWGFCPELRGTPWRGRLRDWQPPDKGDGPIPPRLKPRRPRP